MKNILTDWMPERIETAEDGSLLCRWMYTEGFTFSKPFFEESIAACRTHPFNQKRYKVVSALDFLPSAADAVDANEPDAFVFHVSRCGSTLLTQLLGMDENKLVLAEVPFFDQLLRQKNGISGEERKNILRAAIRLVGQHRCDNRQQLIVKTDSWHLFFAETLREMYPQTPFIFLYRSPEAVIRSHAKRRGSHMIPALVDPALFGLTFTEEYAMNLDRYAAAVLEKYYAKMLAFATGDSRSILLSYDAGIYEELLRACAWAGFPASPQHESAMRERIRFHSKEPGRVFTGDENVPMKNVDFTNLQALFEKLEEKRTEPVAAE